MNKIKKAFNNLITPGETLSQKVVKGGFWVFFLRIINRGFGLIRLIILARILSPNDFGLMGIALLTMATIETFTQTGFQVALIQKKEDIESYLDSAWTVLLLRGFILFIILYFIAPYVAIFFNAPEAKPIIRVIGFSVLFQAFTNIGVTYFKKELEFNKEFIYQLSGTLADFIVAVTAVLILKNVWALVFGLLAGNTARLIASYFIHPYRPHLDFNLGKAKELFGFGRWILGSSILLFLFSQGDDIFVGKLLGVTMLGFYQIAYRISNAPATEITHVISQVTFPAYSKLQDNLPGLREGYLKTLQLTALTSIPLAGGIFILAPEFTTIFLGDKWLPMVPAMQALVLLGLARSMASTTIPVLYAVGKPEIDTRWAIIRLVILATLIYPLTMHWGILGTSIAVFLSYLVSLNGLGFAAMKIMKIRIKDFAIKIAPWLINTVIMVLLISALKISFSSTEVWEFMVCVIVGVSTYLSVTYLIDKFLNLGILPLIKQVFTSFQR